MPLDLEDFEKIQKSTYTWKSVKKKSSGKEWPTFSTPFHHFIFRFHPLWLVLLCNLSLPLHPDWQSSLDLWTIWWEIFWRNRCPFCSNCLEFFFYSQTCSLTLLLFYQKILKKKQFLTSVKAYRLSSHAVDLLKFNLQSFSFRPDRTWGGNFNLWQTFRQICEEARGFELSSRARHLKHRHPRGLGSDIGWQKTRFSTCQAVRSARVFGPLSATFSDVTWPEDGGKSFDKPSEISKSHLSHECYLKYRILERTAAAMSWKLWGY